MRLPDPTIRSHLFALVLAVLLPMVVLVVLLAVLVARHEQRAIEQGAVDRTRAFMSAVDSELHGSVTTLEALAASSSLETGDVSGFHEQARRVLRSQPDWLNITLDSPRGMPLASAVMRFGTPLAPLADRSVARQAARSGVAAVGGVLVEPALNDYGVPVSVPVMRHAEVAYVLTAFVKPDSFAELLRQQQLPASWISGLVGTDGRFIARIPPQPVGRLATAAFRDEIEQAPEGWYRGTTAEGIDVFRAHYRSPISGWAVGLAIPASEVQAAARRASWLAVSGTLVSLTLALGFAFWIGRRIARPVAALSEAATALQRGEAVALGGSRIREVEQVAAALEEAARATRERQVLLEREKEALRSADRAKDEFLAVLGHELRNPLASLTTAAHVLRLAPPGDPRALQARGVIERQTKQMARLVEDLLDISRITMGKAVLDREALDLGDLARGVVRNFRQAGRPGAGEISIHAEHAWVEGDRARLEQVLANLLDNALKFSPPGAPVRVTVRTDEGDAVLTVADLGIGLEREAIGRIFDLFVQGEQGPDRSKGGLGIGLALVKRVVELHGGAVAAASEGVGKGAVFSVRLPSVAKPERAAQPPAQAGAARARSVLIIEDNDDARQMLGALLALGGHEVREAETGASGLQRAQAHRPDVALIDIGLPDLDGYEVARRLRSSEAGRDMKLVAVSGYGQAEDQRRAIEAGFDAHLTKPVSAELLRQALESLR